MPVQVPDDVLHQIFLRITDTRALCYASEVCRQWYRVCMSDPAIWRYLRLSEPNASPSVGRKRKRNNGPVGIRQTIEVMTTRAGSFLAELDLNHIVPSSCGICLKDLRKIKDRARGSLQVLKLPEAQKDHLLASSALVDFAMACCRLRVLHLPSCRGMNLRTLKSIALKCTQLEDVSVASCDAIRGSAAALGISLTPICQTLKKIDVSFTNMYGLPISHFGYSFPNLEEIHADSCPQLFQDDVSNDTLLPDAACFANLTTFSVNAVQDVPLSWILRLWSTGRKLRYFAMNYSSSHYNLETRQFYNLSLQRSRALNSAFDAYVPDLAVLALAGQFLTDEVWQQIFCKMHRTLEVCDMRSNLFLTGALNTKGLDGKLFSQLTCLYFSNTSISNEAVYQILQLSPKLKKFKLDSCRSVTNRQLRRDPLGFKTTVTEL